MGNEQSKGEFDLGNEKQSRRNSKRFSTSSFNKEDSVDYISETLKGLKTEITEYDGVRGDERYDNYMLLLTENSKQLQNVRSSLRNKKKAKSCENLQRDISECIKTLEDRVKTNESKLDAGAEVTNSIIIQKNRKDLQKVARADREKINSLQSMEDKVTKLESEMEIAVSLGDKKQMMGLEKRIQKTLTDLELIPVEKFTPLHEKKEDIGRRLISVHGKLRRAKNRRPGLEDADSESIKSNQTQNLERRKEAENILRQKINSRPKTPNWVGDPRVSQLYAIEASAAKLEDEIQVAVDLEEKKQFVILEKKIQILYTDLEMIQVENYPEYNARKEDISRQLIRLNNKLKKSKQGVNRQSGSHQKDISPLRQTDLATLLIETDKITEDLDKLDFKVSTFNDSKSSETYQNLKKNYVQNWEKIQELDPENAYGKKFRQEATERIKTSMIILNERAKKYESSQETNAVIEKQRINLEQRVDVEEHKTYLEEQKEQKGSFEKQKDELYTIKMEVKKFKQMAFEYGGRTKNEEFDFIDQNLRKLWANLSKVKSVNDDVKMTKNEIIDEIKDTLRYLSSLVEETHQTIDEARQASFQTNLQIPLQTNLQTSPVQVEPLYADINFSNKSNRKVENIEELISQFVKDWEQVSKWFKNPNLDLNSKTIHCQVLEKLSHDIQKQCIEIKAPSARDSSFSNGHYSEIQPKATTSNFRIETANGTSKIGESRFENRLSRHVGRESLLETSFDEPQTYKPVFTIDSQISEKDAQINTGDIQITTRNVQINTRDIQSNTREMEKTIIDKRSSQYVEYAKSLQDIMTIDKNVQDLKKQVSKFNGLKKDKEYGEIEDSLVRCVISLNSIETKNQENLKSAKDEVMQQIKQLQTDLAKQISDNQSKSLTRQKSSELSEIKAIIEQAQHTKKKVDCFSGTYKSIQYNQIEEELFKHIDKLNTLDPKANEKIALAKEQTMHKIKQWLKILDEKSLKVEHSTSSLQRLNGQSDSAFQNQRLSNLTLTSNLPSGQSRLLVQNQTSTQKPTHQNQSFSQNQTSPQNLTSSQDQSVTPRPISENFESQNTSIQTNDSRISAQNLSIQSDQEANRHSFNTGPESAYSRIANIRNELIKLKNSMESFTGMYKSDEYETIMASLVTCTKEIDDIDDKGSSSIRQSIEQYKTYIQDLAKYFEEKLDDF